jgi:pyridoxine kinase
MDMKRQKRVAAIHDISCFGKCSLTVALPILSAAGIETSVIPTAVLSTHTGGFSDFTYRDLTGDILPIARHWHSLGIGFDAIYTGFLGSFEQIDVVLRVFELLRGEETLIVVDPVMADQGKLYSLFSPAFPAGMRRLCEKADVITPNLTEAALLLGEEYREDGLPRAREETDRILRALCDLGPGAAVLTGVGYGDASLGAASYDARAGRFSYAGAPRVDGMYPGTGDVFASAFTAALLRGRTPARACEAAVRFTADSVARSGAAGSDKRFGVNFEAGLGAFAAEMAED